MGPRVHGVSWMEESKQENDISTQFRFIVVVVVVVFVFVFCFVFVFVFCFCCFSRQGFSV
jgi:heme/copper-type cytochrome/quinol oxidase subunit 2